MLLIYCCSVMRWKINEGGGTVSKLHLGLCWRWWWGHRMERDESNCSAVHDAQLRTLALSGKGAEASLSSQRDREALTFCTAWEQLLLSGVRSNDNPALTFFPIWGKLLELLWAAWKSIPGQGRFNGKRGSVAEAWNYYWHTAYVAFLNLSSDTFAGLGLRMKTKPFLSTTSLEEVCATLTKYMYSFTFQCEVLPPI